MSKLPFTLCAASMTGGDGGFGSDSCVCFTQNTMRGLLRGAPLSVPNSNMFTCHDRRGHDVDIVYMVVSRLGVPDSWVRRWVHDTYIS